MTRLLKKGGIESVKSNFIPFAPRARAFPSAVQSVPNAAATAITLDQETFDTDNLHDPVTNNSRLTIKTPGTYLVHGKIAWAAPGGASISTYTQIRKNGVLAGMVGSEIGNLGNMGGEAIGVFECVAGDYFELWGDQRSGGALNTGPSDQLTYLEAIYIGPLTPNMVRDKPVVSYVTPTQFAALTPQDGDEVYLIVDATAGVTWHLRYNAGSSSAYKWEFLGGPLLEAEVDTSEGTASTAYVDLTTAGPAVTLPRAGDYIVTFGGRMDSNSAVAYNYMSPKRGALATSDADGSQIYNSSPTGTWTLDAMRTRKFLGMLAGDVVKSQYRVNGGTGLWRNRYVTVQPIRIS